jgi:hypothetical protein
MSLTVKPLLPKEKGGLLIGGKGGKLPLQPVMNITSLS